MVYPAVRFEVDIEIVECSRGCISQCSSFVRIDKYARRLDNGIIRMCLVDIEITGEDDCLRMGHLSYFFKHQGGAFLSGHYAPMVHVQVEEPEQCTFFLFP